MSGRRILTLALLLAVGGIAWWRLHGGGEPAARPERVVRVQTVPARVGPAPVELAAMAQVVSPHSVAVRPQVGGTLTEVYFAEGADVRAGEPLALIDPQPYRAAVDQARAVLTRDQAALAAAQADYERIRPLAERNFVTPQELQNARAAAAQAEALVQGDRAALQRAQIDLDRTRITAPISGRAGSLSVRPGNVVGSGDALPLVTINQLQPVHVEFSVPQAQLGAVQDALAAGAVAVRVSLDPGAPAVGTGRLVFVDNAVDAATGTVKLRAEVDNAQHRLWPGAFVSAVATLRVEPRAVLVPEAAVQPGASGAFVFRVGADGAVALQNVEVARQVGADLVIAAGLAGGETVVLHPPRNLASGMRVQAGADAGDVERPRGDGPGR